MWCIYCILPIRFIFFHSQKTRHPSQVPRRWYCRPGPCFSNSFSSRGRQRSGGRFPGDPGSTESIHPAENSHPLGTDDLPSWGSYNVRWLLGIPERRQGRGAKVQVFRTNSSMEDFLGVKRIVEWRKREGHRISSTRGDASGHEKWRNEEKSAVEGALYWCLHRSAVAFGGTSCLCWEALQRVSSWFKSLCFPFPFGMMIPNWLSYISCLGDGLKQFEACWNHLSGIVQITRWVHIVVSMAQLPHLTPAA